MRKLFLTAVMLALLVGHPEARKGLPDGFVYLSDVDPSIVQDIRYHGEHNFLGRPVKGYEASECILSIDAAKALKGAQDQLAPAGLGLMVFDCYRPQKAVDDFVAWSAKPADQATKAEFYPRVDKKNFFELGYVAKKSGHSRGSTVDLTVVPRPFVPPTGNTPGQPLVSCYAPLGQRFQDGGLDMGGGFDCMDAISHSLSGAVSPQARANRMLLRQVMEAQGFKPYEYEWWHFTLKNEPFPETAFTFPVSPKP